jgi:hypothetical protein
VHLLEAKVGRERLLALARAALTRPSTRDFRDVLHEWRHPMPKLVRRATGLSLEELVAAWRAALARAATHAPLSSLPRGAFDVRAGSAVAVAVVGALDAPPATPLGCTLSHARLPPQDTYVPPDALARTSFVWSPAERQIDRPIGEMASSGERLLVALDCEDPTLGAPVRLLARRVTVR